MAKVWKAPKPTAAAFRSLGRAFNRVSRLAFEADAVCHRLALAIEGGHAERRLRKRLGSLTGQLVVVFGDILFKRTPEDP